MKNRVSKKVCLGHYTCLNAVIPTIIKGDKIRKGGRYLIIY